MYYKKVGKKKDKEVLSLQALENGLKIREN